MPINGLMRCRSDNIRAGHEFLTGFRFFRPYVSQVRIAVACAQMAKQPITQKRVLLEFCRRNPNRAGSNGFLPPAEPSFCRGITNPILTDYSTTTLLRCLSLTENKTAGRQVFYPHTHPRICVQRRLNLALARGVLSPKHNFSCAQPAAHHHDSRRYCANSVSSPAKFCGQSIA